MKKQHSNNRTPQNPQSRKLRRSTRGKTKLLRLNSPLAGRLFPLFTCDADASQPIEDGHLAELVVNLPGIQIFRDWGGYIVDVETAATIKTDRSGAYTVRHERRRVDRDGAFRHLLAAVVPKEFSDLLPSPVGVTRKTSAP